MFQEENNEKSDSKSNKENKTNKNKKKKKKKRKTKTQTIEKDKKLENGDKTVEELTDQNEDVEVE